MKQMFSPLIISRNTNVKYEIALLACYIGTY